MDYIAITNDADFAEYGRFQLRLERVVNHTKQPTETHARTHAHTHTCTKAYSIHGESNKHSNVVLGGNVISAGWQVTLCDSIWHVSSRSDEACCELLYSVYLYLTLGVRQHELVSRQWRNYNFAPPRQTFATGIINSDRSGTVK